MTFKLLLDGMLVDGFDTLDIVNPATGQVFATAPRANATHLDLAIAAANKAFTDWSARRYADRGDHLRHFADAVEARFDDLARLLTQEQGKPLAEARHEIGASIAALRHFADQELGRAPYGKPPTNISSNSIIRSASWRRSSVELPDSAIDAQARARANHRQHRHRQAGADHAADDVATREHRR